VADLAGDTRVTQEAQEAARQILAQDPDLSLPQHEPIRQSVVDLFRGSEDIFN
jgi:ATP-dependent DNA helicase RecG